MNPTSTVGSYNGMINNNLPQGYCKFLYEKDDIYRWYCNSPRRKRDTNIAENSEVFCVSCSRCFKTGKNEYRSGSYMPGACKYRIT